ncbi:MAG: glycosyltransferase family 2 protein, partial [Halioglobus sp.]
MSDIRRVSMAVCICTFRRPDELARLLRGLDEQSFPADVAVNLALIVVDNSPGREAERVCSQYSGRWRLLYLVEPRTGISHARNTSLAAVSDDCDFIAMIDDDEVPDPGWLASLLEVQQRSGADVVVGRTRPAFPTATPGWVEETGFFLKPRNQDDLAEMDPNPPAATCNVMIDVALLREPGLAFDPALGLSGGEDKMLFQSLKQQGRRFAWAPDARVTEFIPPERARLSYMLRESYRRGWVVHRIKLGLKSRSALHSLKIVLKLLVRSLLGFLGNTLMMLLNLARGRAA